MKNIFRITLSSAAVLAALLLAGCTVATTPDFEDTYTVMESQEVSDEPAEDDRTVDEHIRNLIEYADENVRTLTVSSASYSAAFNGDDINYLIADVSGDGKEELIAVGLYDGTLSHFKIFYDNGESIDEVYSGHIGFLEGHLQNIAFYENEYFIYYESGSTSTYLEISLNRYNPLHEGPSRPIIPVIKTHQQFNWENPDTEDIYYINNSITEDIEKYNALRETMTAACLTEEDFMSLDGLCEKYGVVLEE